MVQYLHFRILKFPLINWKINQQAAKDNVFTHFCCGRSKKIDHIFWTVAAWDLQAMSLVDQIHFPKAIDVVVLFEDGFVWKWGVRNGSFDEGNPEKMV